jgi:hypothetical protein
MKLKNFALVWLLLLMPVWAQSSTNAAQLAQQLAQSQELPTNVGLRFQILAHELGQLGDKSPSEDLLYFFSDTRVMFWNRPSSPNLSQSMRSFEDQMVALAAANGRALDLHGVGYAPAAASQSRLLSTERVTAGGLSNWVAQTEQSASNALSSNNSADLLFLRDNLTRLREDLNDGNVNTESIRSVMGARARFLAGDSRNAGGDQLIQNLNVLGEILRANFPPDRLRQNPGGTFNL